MKQGLYFSLPVDFEGLDFDRVGKIEFIFKKMKKNFAPAIKTAIYPDECTRSDNTVYIRWLPEETYLVDSGKTFYMDTRITYTDTNEQPETNIQTLVMSETLFDKE